MRKGFVELFRARHHRDLISVGETFLQHGNIDEAQIYVVNAIRDRYGKKVSRAIESALENETRFAKTGNFKKIDDKFFGKQKHELDSNIQALLRESSTRFRCEPQVVELELSLLNNVAIAIQGGEYSNPALSRYIFESLVAKRLDPLDHSRVELSFDDDGILVDFRDRDMDDFEEYVLTKTQFGSVIKDLITATRESRKQSIIDEQEMERGILGYDDTSGYGDGIDVEHERSSEAGSDFFDAGQSGNWLVEGEADAAEAVDQEIPDRRNGESNCVVRIAAMRAESCKDPLQGQDPVDFIAKILIRDIYGRS